MRILNHDITRDPKVNLGPIQMNKLGPTVVLAGPNGAGKSRLFKMLKTWNERFETEAHLADLLKQYQTRLDMFLSGTNLSVPHPPVHVEQTRKSIAEIIQRIQTRRMVSLTADTKPVIVPFVPTKLNITDPNGMPPQDALAASKNVEALGIGHLPAGTFAYLQVLQNRKREATHPDHTISREEDNRAVAEYNRLESLVRKFLNTGITRSPNGEAELFGMPLGKCGLSDGQKVMLELCVAIHAQGASLNDLILFMDEPENHLHPAALLDLVEAIQAQLVNGQLWIATHSVSLLSHFDPTCIWWMVDGTVQHAGSKPEMVLKGLVGEGERIEKLGDFLGLPAALATNNFAYQCLLPPAVVGADDQDPQTCQIRRVIETYRPNDMLRILDFGAGRGRLVSAFRDGVAAVEKVAARIDYRAFDVAAELREECEAAITRLYGNSDKRYFDSEKQLRAVLDPQSVGVVVMCNVLHEIDPMEWMHLFAQDGMIRQLLRPDGFLLIVENLEMRVGEKAHQRGFLVLDTGDLRRLFEITEKDTGFLADDARNDGRLKAHLIPCACLGRATTDTLRDTLKQMRHLAMEEIKTLRGEPPSYKNGRKHAYYVQQLANSQLALAIMGA